MRIPLPPEEMQMGVGQATADKYLNIGSRLKDALLSYTGVKPTTNILDIGCGSGRLARHLVDYIEPPGSYVGMDIQKPFIDWCNANIAPANPAFSFYNQDIYNGHYNPKGKYQASEYSFPFEDESFGLIVLTSVFTHLLSKDALNYLKEIRRLLKPEGRCFSTWFLLGHDIETKFMKPNSLEGQTGYGFRYCVEMLEKSELTLSEEPILGNWRGDGGPMGQDLLLLSRSTNAEGSLLSRYAAPKTPRRTQPELENSRGSVQSMDPVANSITLRTEGGPRTFRMAEKVNIRVNRGKANSSSLKKGQLASLRFARDTESGAEIAVAVGARDYPRVEQVNGIIEFVDLEFGVITLNHAGDSRTFEFDPRDVKVRVNGETVDPGELRNGQKASLQYVPKVIAIGSADPSTKVQ